MQSLLNLDNPSVPFEYGPVGLSGEKRGSFFVSGTTGKTVSLIDSQDHKLKASLATNDLFRRFATKAVQHDPVFPVFKDTDRKKLTQEVPEKTNNNRKGGRIRKAMASIRRTLHGKKA